MKTTLASLLFLVSLSFAVELRTDLIEQHRINEIPNFFFKVSMDGKLIAYNHSYTNGIGQNELLQLSTGRITSLPGPFDPVYINHTPLMIIPRGKYAQSYDFFILDPETGETRNIYHDWNLRGFYQSVGILSHDSEKVDFRVITEGKTGYHMLRDYRYLFATEMVEPLGEAGQLCSGTRLKLPMLSKDGREIGAIDKSREKTTIFRIKEDGTCEPVLKLSEKTGKVNFSYDGKFLTYHIYNTKNLEVTDDFVDTPSSAYVADVFVYDRQSRRKFRLTNNHSSNSLYPDFLEGGDIFFVDHPHQAREKVSFLRVKPQFAQTEDFLSGEWEKLQLRPSRKSGGEGFLFQFDAETKARMMTLSARHGRVKIHRIQLVGQDGTTRELSFRGFVGKNKTLKLPLRASESVVPKELFVRAEGYDDDEVQLDIGLSSSVETESFTDGSWETTVSPTRRSGGEELVYYFDDPVSKITLRALEARVMIHKGYFVLENGDKVALSLAGDFVMPGTPFHQKLETDQIISELHIQAEGYDSNDVKLQIEVTKRPTSVLGPDYESMIKPVFVRNRCMECHDSELKDRQSIPANWLTSSGGQSPPILRVLETDQMPVQGPPMSEADKRLVKLWVNTGLR